MARRRRAHMVSIARVLVVDDQPEVALVLRDALEGFGYAAKIAVSGREALGLLSTYQPDVVLLDLWMPGLPGEAVLDEIRHRAPTVPIVVVTGNRDEALAQDVLSAGAFDYVPKPFDLTVLERIVGAALAERTRRLA